LNAFVLSAAESKYPLTPPNVPPKPTLDQKISLISFGAWSVGAVFNQSVQSSYSNPFASCVFAYLAHSWYTSWNPSVNPSRLAYNPAAGKLGNTFFINEADSVLILVENLIFCGLTFFITAPMLKPAVLPRPPNNKPYCKISRPAHFILSPITPTACLEASFGVNNGLPFASFSLIIVLYASPDKYAPSTKFAVKPPPTKPEVFFASFVAFNPFLPASYTNFPAKPVPGVANFPALPNFDKTFTPYLPIALVANIDPVPYGTTNDKAYGNSLENLEL